MILAHKRQQTGIEYMPSRSVVPLPKIPAMDHQNLANSRTDGNPTATFRLADGYSSGSPNRKMTEERDHDTAQQFEPAGQSKQQQVGDFMQEHGLSSDKTISEATGGC